MTHFLTLMATNFIGLSINGMGSFYIMHVLYKRKIRLSRRLLSYPAFFLFVALVGTAMTYPEIERQGNYGAWTITFISIFQFGTLVLYYSCLFKSKDFKKMFPSVLFTFATESVFQNCFYLILPWLIPIFGGYKGEYLYYFMQIIFVAVTVIPFTYLISRTKMIDYIRDFIENGIAAVLITMLYLIILLINQYFFIANNRGIGVFSWVSLAVYILAFFIFAFISRDFYNHKQLQHSEALLQQQQLYVNRLEQIQQELRVIQHDYKNVVAGLYAQADEGNAEAVKEYIHQKLLHIDDTVQNDIRESNQISRITNMELKGLLLVKMLEARSKSVNIELEVLYKVEEIHMETKDLLRCLGILLDNAIEGSQNTCTKNVSVVVLQEDGKTTIVVKNDVSGIVKLSDIWKSGYSTKGPNRGLGLNSYQEILAGYENVFCETKADDKYFVQIISIT